VSPGMHVLSNAQLDTPWPKVQRMRHKFEELLKKYGQDEIPETKIIENVMKDTVYADRSLLPTTGCDPDWEYKLSPIFIYSDSDRGPYGTRSMVVLSLKPTGEMAFYEQYLEDGKWKEHKITYEIKSDKLNCESEVYTD
ncbi:NRDE family protein, partial [Soehngenia saccharolytica]